MQNVLQNQIKKLESSLVEAEKASESQQMKHSAIINDYSTKLLTSEKKLFQVQERLKEQDEKLGDMMSRSQHDEIVFNLEMAYNMSIQEQKDSYEAQIKGLENKLNNIDSTDTVLTDSDEIKRLNSQLQSLTKQHRTNIDAIRNEAIFEARQEIDGRMKRLKEDLEQSHLEEVNRIMEDNSKERQRLVHEMEVIQARGDHVNSSFDQFNQSAGRISISRDNEYHLLDTEYEYLKKVLYKYLKGEHTSQLLKVIVAILRFSENEKRELLGMY